MTEVQKIVELLKEHGVVNGDYDPANGTWEVETKTWWYEELAKAVIEACASQETTDSSPSSSQGGAP
ncbi:MAG TPA: hypothetical protein VFX60_19175 [Micromonospora sp.]|nr:hypothetical protein [Micromonospora sp.]